MEASYVCTRCNFKFKFDQTKKPATKFRCPYCGNDDKVVAGSTTTEQLLRR